MELKINGESRKVEDSCNGKTLVEQLRLQNILVMEVNGLICDLNQILREGDVVHFFSFMDPKGKEVFWHTSSHILAQAVLRLWPQAKPTIGPAIENGFYYDFANLHISEDDFEKIETEFYRIVKENHEIKREVLSDKKKALDQFQSNPYKVELIKGFEDDSLITVYRQGEFIDLCRGPHLQRVSEVKAFKVLKTSGAYWKGDREKEVLTRIYGISYPDKKLLKEHLLFLEEVKRRDHRVIGNKLGLFSILEEAPGMPLIHPKGMIMWNHLVTFLRSLLSQAGYLEIKTPQIMSIELWEKSGHCDHYLEHMYVFDIEGRRSALKPMNCPGAVLYYKLSGHSYRQLPLRIAEIGHVHRHELSGSLSGLFRVRSFHQDDAHLFIPPSDIKSEILDIFGMVEKIYSTFGLSYQLELSTRPEKSLGSDEEWAMATEGLMQALEAWGQPFKLNQGDGAFYGPKIDIHIRDILGRSWQCGTIQLDLSLPQKFQLQYKDKDGDLKRPILIHRAIFGSIERFWGILIEHFGGKFPLWLSPLPFRIIPIGTNHIEYSHQVKKALQKAGLICDLDLEEGSVSKKIRTAQLMQINYMITLGDREIETQTITIRTRDNVIYNEMKLSNFLSFIQIEFESKSLVSLISTD